MIFLLLVFIVIPLVIIIWITYLVGMKVHRSLLRKESPYAGLLSVLISLALFALLVIGAWYIFTHTIIFRR